MSLAVLFNTSGLVPAPPVLGRLVGAALSAALAAPGPVAGSGPLYVFTSASRPTESGS